MTPPLKALLYLLLVGTAVLGLMLEQLDADSLGSWMWRFALTSVLLLVPLLEWVIPWHTRKRRVSVCKAALKRLRNEKHLFEQLFTAQQSGERLEGIHKHLLEVDSYKWTERDISPLIVYWKYWSQVSAILREIKRNRDKPLEDMRLERLRHLLAVLEEQLEDEVARA